MVRKYGFFFGAGAEACYGLPLGAEYTQRTMLRKNQLLYEALKEFYKARLNDDYVSRYYGEYLFSKDSNTFREIMYRAAEACRAAENVDPFSKKLVDAWYSEDLAEEQLNKAKENFKNFCIEAYKIIVTESEERQQDGRYRNIRENLSYYGAIEKDFSTIINPKKAGMKKFWRLINYFWSAFFSILEPLLERVPEHNVFSKNDNVYASVLGDLAGIIEYIYSIDYGDISLDYRYKDGIRYYIELKELEPLTVFTTNYTPFVKSIFGDRKSIYLSGELSRFELPQTLETINLCETQLINGVLAFPYIFTQAPIKPLVETHQMREYSKALQSLEEIEILVIIGYSLCENDNHINAMIRDYLKQDNKELVYFTYCINRIEYDEEQVKERILNCLKMNGNHVQTDYRERVIVAPIYSDTTAGDIRSVIIEKMKSTFI